MVPEKFSADFIVKCRAIRAHLIVLPYLNHHFFYFLKTNMLWGTYLMCRS